MEENIRVKIEESYDKLLEKPNIIYNIFKDFFGEEFVDMQGYPSLEHYTDAVDTAYEPNQILEGTLFRTSSFSNIFILVRFPEVRVTNENDRYIDIWELYVKVCFNYKGESLGYFEMNRAEYDYAQLKGSYMHSHISGIPFSNPSLFCSPCLGEGPIRYTLASLATDFDELRWQLFCYELSKYVQVESLSGGPYKKLEQLGQRSLTPISSTWMMNTKKMIELSYISREDIGEFVTWLIRRNKLKFDYNESYGIAMSYIEWTVFLSNEFIEWINIRINEGFDITYNNLLRSGVLKQGVIKDGKIYYDTVIDGVPDYSRLEGARICTFKGQEITLKIRGNNTPNTSNMSNFINFKIAEAIGTAILQIINYNYGNNNNNKEACNFGDGKVPIFI